MAAVLTPEIRVFPDPEILSRSAAAGVVALIGTAVQAQGFCAVALSGGSTPRRLYELLADAHSQEIPWDRMRIYWGDERYLPPDDPGSNYRLAQETLLDRVPIPSANVHRMPTEPAFPADAARAYDELLRNHFGPRLRFDLMLLGLGPDGHVASVFPGSAAVAEKERWVMAVRAPIAPVRRLTLTLPAINQAARVYFLASGAAKAAALVQAVMGPVAPWRFPASAVRPPDGAVVWWVDEAAAARLPGGRSRRPQHA